MRKIYSFFTMLAIMVTALNFTACSSDDDNNSNNNNNKNVTQDYDVLQINGEDYACYGYRCAITYTSKWDSSNYMGDILLPCGKLSDAQKGVYNCDYMFEICLEGYQDLKKGSRLENYQPIFVILENWNSYYCESGSATITDKQNDKYITIKFDSFKCGDGISSYTLNGTVQLDLDED